MEYRSGVKLKISVTLAEDVLAAIEAVARADESRSQAIERLLRENFAAKEGAAIDERDRNLIDLYADELNEEAIDVLGYQVET